MAVELEVAIRRLESRLFWVEGTSTKLAKVCHGDLVTDKQIDALAMAVDAQADAIREIGRVLIELRKAVE